MRALLTVVALSAVLILSTVRLAPSQAPTAAEVAEYALMARAGAPTPVSFAAQVAMFDTATKQFRVLVPGTNGITCALIPDGTNAPVCADANAWQWLVDAFSGKEKPTNTGPGIAYMAQGGWHFETPDGMIVMAPGENTKAVGEPPHWMLTWPIKASTTGLPTKPNPGGVYVMFDGTPYAHLMVYEDPGKMMRP